MSKFDYMEKTVNEICSSLENTPEHWKFETYTFKNILTDVEFWAGEGNSSITESLESGTADTVFSVEQGKRIRKSYNIARKKSASVRQQKINESFGKMADNKLNSKGNWWVFLPIFVVVFILLLIFNH